MSRCPKCETRKGKRQCPALATLICSRCCGEHRLKSIACPPDCQYLEGETYQSERRHERSRTRGRKFLEELGAIFSDRAEFDFALMLHADLYAFATTYGGLDDAGIGRALEGLKGMLSPVYIPGGESDPLTAYLHDRIEKSERYQTGPAFGSRDRLRVLDALARHVRNAAGESPARYFDEVTHFFEPMDPTRDFGFSEDDFRALHGDRGERGGPRRTAGGLILPS